jgi:hypothetical protein
MPIGMTIEEFLNACEERLRRAESYVRQPLNLQTELENLEELLRKEWPNAIVEIKEVGLSTQYKEKLDIIFKRITKIEKIAHSATSLFDGLEDFMQRPSKRK